MKFIAQAKHSHQCGQTCVAMIADRTPEEICRLMHNYRGTQAKDLIRALNLLKIPCDQKTQRFPKLKNWQVQRDQWPSFCITQIAIEGQSSKHVFVMLDGRIYDPSCNGFYPVYMANERPVWFIGIYKRPKLDERGYTPPTIRVCPNCDVKRPLPFSTDNNILHCGCYWEGGGRAYHAPAAKKDYVERARRNP